VLVLGIDPGSQATGYAVVRRSQGRFELLEAGVIRTRSKDPIPERLATIHAGLVEVIQRTRPESAGIEAIFKYKSSESALRLGQARGVALLAAAQAGLEISDYNAMTVKKTVGGHGRAGKPEMIRIVARLLGLAEPLPSDASDAAAIAMTHLLQSAFKARLKGAS
jgi:crossover junction endodeoxyribonuclease RuvC